MAPRKRTFDELIDDSGHGCWSWLGGNDRRGYGRFYIGTLNGRVIHIGAHRYAWQRANRPLASGEVVMHLCDNPSCVRPDHLTVGTQGDNLHDAATKGRLSGSIHGKGSQHRFAKLDENTVREIRNLLARQVSQRLIAERFGVNQSQISRIKSGLRWQHV